MFGIMLGTAPNAKAEGKYLPPVSNKVYSQECGACHMAFQPQLLPSPSWEKIMGNLSSHFGEDASLSEAKATEIKNYLLDNSANRGGTSWMMRGMDSSNLPVRITDMAWWQREHNRHVKPETWTSTKVKSKANCEACHTNAAKGLYEDD